MCKGPEAGRNLVLLRLEDRPIHLLCGWRAVTGANTDKAGGEDLDLPSKGSGSLWRGVSRSDLGCHGES